MRMNAQAGFWGVVRKNVGTDEPGVVVDCLLQEFVAPDMAASVWAAFAQVAGPGVRFTLHRPVDPVPAAVGDPAEFLKST